MSITADQPAATHEPPVGGSMPVERLASSPDAPPTRHASPARLWWLGVGVLTIAGVVLVVPLVGGSGADAPANRVAVTVDDTDTPATELDVHGIPTWWSQRAPRG